MDAARLRVSARNGSGRPFGDGASGIAATWFAAEAHSDVMSTRYDEHSLIMRLSFGRGRESIESDGLRPTQWRAWAVEYRPPGIVHRHATDHAADWICVRVSAARFAELAELTGADAPTQAACAQGRTCPAAGATALSIRRAAIAGSLDGELLRDSTLGPFCVALLRSLAGTEPPVRRMALTRSRLNAVLDYVETRLSDPIGLDEMASAAGFSRFHFAKAFKDTTGHSPYRYVLSRRIDLARRLLARGRDPIAQVAFASGFASQAHMTALFKRALGVTPARYRLHVGGAQSGCRQGAPDQRYGSIAAMARRT